MINIKKTYRLEEMEITVNKREIVYDFLLERAYYAYNGINKKDFKLAYDKWLKIVKKYNLSGTYSVEKYEELNKCLMN